MYQNITVIHQHCYELQSVWQESVQIVQVFGTGNAHLTKKKNSTKDMWQTAVHMPLAATCTCVCIQITESQMSKSDPRQLCLIISTDVFIDSVFL